MKKSIWIVALLATVALLGAFVLTGCKETTEPAETSEAVTTEEATATPEVTPEPEEEVPDFSIGYFERWAGGGDYQNIFVFHPDGTFYYSKMNESSFTAGTWELVDSEKEYAYFVDGDESNEQTATAEQYFILKHYDGFVEEVAYANDMIYDMTVTGFKSDFDHVRDKSIAPEDETPVTVVEYQLEGDEYSTMQLQHSGVYIDTINDYIEGTWAVDGNTYTLTPDGEETTAALAVAEDGKSAVYTATDGTEYNLVIPYQGPEVLMTFEGEQLNLDVYSDGTCAILYGAQVAVEGTWSYANYAFSLTLDGEDVPVTMLDDDTHAFVFDYSIGDGQIQDTLSVDSSVWGAAGLDTVQTAEPEILFSLVGESNDKVVLDCYDDGTCILVYTGMGDVYSGTWSYANYQLSVTLNIDDGDGETEMEVTMDDSHAFVMPIDLKGGQMVDNLIVTSDVWGPVLTAE